MCTRREVSTDSIVVRVISKRSYFAEQPSTTTLDCPALCSSNRRAFAWRCHAKSQCALQPCSTRKCVTLGGHWFLYSTASQAGCVHTLLPAPGSLTSDLKAATGSCISALATGTEVCQPPDCGCAAGCWCQPPDWGCCGAAVCCQPPDCGAAVCCQPPLPASCCSCH